MYRQKFYLVTIYQDNWQERISAEIVRTKEEGKEKFMEFMEEVLSLEFENEKKRAKEIRDFVKKHIGKDKFESPWTDFNYSFLTEPIEVPLQSVEYEMSDEEIVQHTIEAQNFEADRVKSFYPKLFMEEWLFNEMAYDIDGWYILECMDYDVTKFKFPFSVAELFEKGEVKWTDPHGNNASISFQTDYQEPDFKIRATVSYRNKSNSIETSWTEYDGGEEEHVTPTKIYKWWSHAVAYLAVEILGEIFPFSEYPHPNYDYEDDKQQ